jgi:HAD superfamily hydrolase (TIGR01509 family)
MKSAVEGVLFDLDGTLADTEPYWIECEHTLVSEFGGTWTSDDAHSIVGFDLIDAADELRTRGGVPLSSMEIIDRLLAGVMARIDGVLPWRPGARELLADVRAAGIPCAIVTMSWRRLADAVIAAAPAGSFQASVTGDEVENGKPHPEPYVRAAHLLGVEPSRCVAIEDSPTGVASAMTAGCATLGVPHVVPVPPADGLTLVGSLADVELADLVELHRRHADRISQS